MAGLKTKSRSLINIRVSDADRTLIDRGAEALGKTRSEFMLETARNAATDAILDSVLIRLDPAAFERFKALMDAPPKPNERLIALMKTKAPWE